MSKAKEQTAVEAGNSPPEDDGLVKMLTAPKYVPAIDKVVIWIETWSGKRCIVREQCQFSTMEQAMAAFLEEGEDQEPQKEKQAWGTPIV